MEQNIVMVVHGIGEQQPGETIDRLVGAATQRLDLHGRVSGHTELLVDNPEGRDAKNRQMQLFPCAIRRTTIPRDAMVDKQCIPEEQDILAAEVYWADLSKAPNGMLWIVKDLLHTVLALGYLAIDNVEYTTAEKSPLATKLVRAFVWLFYALIAPCNALMLAGALSLLVFDFAFPDDWQTLRCAAIFSIGIWGLLTIITSYQARKAARNDLSYLARWFWLGATIISGCLLVLTVIITASLAEGDQTAEALFENIAYPLVGLMIAGWAISLILLLMMAIHSCVAWALLWRRGTIHPGRAVAQWRAHGELGLTAWLRDKQTIYVPTCSAMMFIWTLLSASFWAAFSGSVVKVIGPSADNGLFRAIYDTQLPRATSTLSFILTGMGVLIVVGLAVALLRHRRKDHLSLTLQGGRADIWLGRIILNPIMAGALFLLVLWVGWGSIEALLVMLEIIPAPSGEDAALLIAGLFGALLLTFRQQVGAGLGVARDVTNYSVRTGRRMIRDAHDLPRYPIREQMLHRFDLVLAYLRQQMPDAKRLIVVSHSQGTVIAATSLVNARELPDKVYLVTMGSPLDISTSNISAAALMYRNCPDGWPTG